MRSMQDAIPIAAVSAEAYRVPTEAPESDGTFSWDATTLVLVRLDAGGCQGIGYSYADTATACLIRDTLGPLMRDQDALATGAHRHRLLRAVRNLGRPGICSLAISALDIALWDLKAKLLDRSLASLLGMTRPGIEAYASGGFTSYSVERLQAQFADWQQRGFRKAKMKVGRTPDQDPRRLAAAREIIGDAVELFVDANGAYSRSQAQLMAQAFEASAVRWFEEPVSSDDLDGLRLLRERAPPGMAVSAGEYGFDLFYFRRMLEARAIDVLQADATRCGGVSGFLGAAALCEAFDVPLSSHCAPALHLPLCCATQQAVHLEYFHDHARLEQLLFDGAATPERGQLTPDQGRPGLGIEFKQQDAQCYRVA